MSGRYFEPTSIEDALALAGEHGPEARFVAGGTDLVVGARRARVALPEVLISLHRVAGLDQVAVGADGSLRLGAGVSHAVLCTDPVVTARYTALADGAALVGSPATRHVGTLGGNLCNGSPANDTGSPLLAFGAAVELTCAEGRREVPLDDFFVGPGRVSLEPGELLTAVALRAPEGRVGSAYLRLDYRRAMEIAVVGAAATLCLGEDDVVTSASVALTAVAPTCIRVPSAAECLVGHVPSSDLLREAAALGAEAARPIDDVRAPADYRTATVPVIIRRALACALRRAKGEAIEVPATLTTAFGVPGEAA